MAAQHIAKTHSHTLHIRVARKGLDEHFADALGTAHHTGGVHSLIGGKLHEPLHVVFAGAHQQIFGAQNIVLDRFCRADLHQRHMLVCCRMEHHSGMICFKNLIQTLFIADGANEHRYRDIPAVLLLQLHQKLIGAVLVDIKNKQLAGLEAHHLTAQFAADGAAAARDQNGLAGEVAGDLIGIQRHLIAGKEVRRVQLAEGSLLRCTAAHQLRVTEQLHRTMGADAQIDDMVQLAALQGRNGDDDAVDAVALAQVRDILQRALHRHPVDGLVEFCGIIVHRHHRVTIFLIGFAHVDGPCTGFACTYDHHRAVGVLAGSAAQLFAQRMVQKQPPCQTAAAHQQQDEHRRHAVGRVEQHTVDAQTVDTVDDNGRHSHRSRQTHQVAFTGILPQYGVQPAEQKAGNVHRHDPWQIFVQKLTVMRPPGSFHCSVCPQQKRKIKAECNNGCIQQHKQRPARKHLRRVLFIFHKKVLFLHTA